LGRPLVLDPAGWLREVLAGLPGVEHLSVGTAPSASPAPVAEGH
jgi:hypothetical protein